MTKKLEQQITELVSTITNNELKETLANLLLAMQASQEASKLLKSEKDNPEKALPFIEKAQSVVWPSSQVWHQHGLALYRSKQYALAIPSYQKSIELSQDKDWRWSLNHLVNCYTHAKQLEAGWLYFDGLALERPDWRWVWHERANLAEKLKRRDDVIPSYKRAILAHTEDCQPSAKSLADYIKKSGTPQLGVQHFTELRKKAAKSWPLWHYQGWFQWQTGSYADAETSLRQAIHLHHRDGEFWTWVHLAAMYYQWGKYKDAAETFANAVLQTGKSDPDLWRAWKGQGDSLKKIGNYPEAILAYEKAVKYDHNLAELYYLLGECFENSGQITLAFESYTQSFRSDTNYTVSKDARDRVLGTLHKELLVFLDTRFNEEELRELCFNLRVDYDSLPTQGKRSKARELITYQERNSNEHHHGVIELIVEIRNMRSGVSFP